MLFHVNAVLTPKLGLTVNDTLLDDTVAGRDAGSAEIAGIAIVTTTQPDAVLTLRYPVDPAGGSLPPAGTPVDGSTSHLMIIRIA